MGRDVFQACGGQDAGTGPHDDARIDRGRAGGVQGCAALRDSNPAQTARQQDGHADLGAAGVWAGPAAVRAGGGGRGGLLGDRDRGRQQHTCRPAAGRPDQDPEAPAARPARLPSAIRQLAQEVTLR